VENTGCLLFSAELFYIRAGVSAKIFRDREETFGNKMSQIFLTLEFGEWTF